MAYAVELDLTCQAKPCQRKAMVEVRTRRNEPVGKFCRSCGAKRLAAVQASEE